MINSFDVSKTVALKMSMRMFLIFIYFHFPKSDCKGFGTVGTAGLQDHAGINDKGESLCSLVKFVGGGPVKTTSAPGPGCLFLE